MTFGTPRRRGFLLTGACCLLCLLHLAVVPGYRLPIEVESKGGDPSRAGRQDGDPLDQSGHGWRALVFRVEENRRAFNMSHPEFCG